MGDGNRKKVSFMFFFDSLVQNVIQLFGRLVMEMNLHKLNFLLLSNPPLCFSTQPV
jgi:hypothetical protein